MMLKRSFLFLAMFLFSAPAFATNRAAASCSATDIQAKVDLSSTGDTVQLPSCSATDITTVVTVTVGIRITGQPCTWGVNPVPGSVASPPSTPTCATILGNGVASGPIFSFNVSAGADFRLDNIKFVAGSGQVVETQGLIEIRGQDKGWRIDHNWFSNPFAARTVFLPTGQSWSYGLIDFNYFDFTTHGAQGIEAFMDLWSGHENGDGSWATDTNLGSTAAIYLENNFETSIFPGRAFVDGGGGARFVARFNTIINDFIGSHGTESTHRNRGVRYVEAYGNDMSSPMQDNDKALFLRSGTALFFKNTTDGYISGVKAFNYRACFAYTPWGSSGTVGGESDGTSLFDTNLGGLIASGTHTGSNGAVALTDSGGSFSSYAPGYTYPGRGYFGADHHVINTTRGWSSFITATTGTTITSLNPDSCAGGSYIWNTGDSYQIRSAYPTLDQTGFGKGDLLSGGDGVTQPTPAGWPNQAAEPVYSFLNTMTNVDGTFPAFGGDTHVQTARDLIVDNCAATPCVTSGVLASIPATCVIGAGYWATNQGSWNDGSNSHYTGQGVLYRCTSTNTWTLYYTPANFPFAASSCTPDHLTFTAQPSSVAVNVALGTVTVSIDDSGGNNCPGATNTVTIANKGGTCAGMTLGGTKSGAASGSFTTTNLTEDVAGACTLSATASGLTGADSNAFTISAAGTGGGIGARLRLNIR